MAQLKFLQHSFPIGIDLQPQSVFGGSITSGESLAEAATELIFQNTHVPAGRLNVRITGDMNRIIGRDVRSAMRETSFLTVIFGPPLPSSDDIPDRVPIACILAAHD